MFAVFICMFVAFASAEETCELPLQPNIDWNRVAENWKLVISDDPPPHDSMFHCITATITREDSEAVIKLSGTARNGDNLSLTMRAWEATGGQYEALLYPDALPADQLRQAIDFHKQYGSSIGLPIISTAFLTDYSTYFIILACTEQGKKDIWVFSPYRDITVDDTLRYVNELRLHDGWRSEQLKQSTCGSTK